jgi:hypothetical protein
VCQDGRGDYVYQQLHESLPIHHLEVSSSYVASTVHPDLNNCRSGMGRRSTAAASRIWGCGSSSSIPQGSHAQTREGLGERLCDHLQPHYGRGGAGLLQLRECEAATRTAPPYVPLPCHWYKSSLCCNIQRAPALRSHDLGIEMLCI